LKGLAMRHLLGCWPKVAAWLRKAGKIALFLDFDGTLVPFRPRPEEARLPSPTRRVLQRLVRRPSLRVWVITGRRRADVLSRIRVPGVRCLGLYGWEDGASGALSETAAPLLAQAREALASQLPPVPGVWIEDKGVAFAVHFRGARQDSIRHAAVALDHALVPFANELRVIDEEFCWAVVPRPIEGKGRAARRQWHVFHPGSLPIYIGDGKADEAAFVALARGVTVCVGQRRMTRARFRLRNPAEVRSFLEKLEIQVR
jgi:trehalose 6-phosphate phosphatase